MMIPCSGKILLCIIIVGRVPDGVVCELDELIGSLKVNLIVTAYLVCMSTQEIRDTNPNQKGIYTHIGKITSQAQNRIFALLV